MRWQILEGFIIFRGTGMHGFTHEAEKTWISGSFIRDLSIFCILDIILTRAGRMFGNSGSAGKNNKPHFTTFLFSSFTLHAGRQQKAVLPASYLQQPKTRRRDQLLRDRSARNRQPLHTPKLFPLSPPKQRQLRSP